MLINSKTNGFLWQAIYGLPLCYSEEVVSLSSHVTVNDCLRREIEGKRRIFAGDFRASVCKLHSPLTCVFSDLIYILAGFILS